MDSDGKPDQMATFASGLKHPYGWRFIRRGLIRSGFTSAMKRGHSLSISQRGFEGQRRIAAHG